MPEQYDIVAANGTPVNAIGYKPPVLCRGSRCFILGDERDFAVQELASLESEGFVTALERPISLLSILGPSVPDSFRASEARRFGLSCYILYVDAESIRKLDALLGLGPERRVASLLHEHEITLCDRRVALRNSPQVLAFALAKRDMLRLLENLWDAIRANLVDFLVSNFVPEQASKAVWVATDDAARMLYLAAFNESSAREAISFKTLAGLHLRPTDLSMQWTVRAAQAWDIRASEEFWLERAHHVALAVRGRALIRSTPEGPMTKEVLSKLRAEVSGVRRDLDDFKAVVTARLSAVISLGQTWEGRITQIEDGIMDKAGAYGERWKYVNR